MVRYSDKLTRTSFEGSVASRMRTLIKTLLVLTELTALAFYFAYLFPKMQTGTDFADFYVGAQIVAQGHGHELYNPSLQHEFQVRYFEGARSYFIHPAFETLIYLPFCLFPPARAYFLWCLFNTLILIAVSKVLATRVPLKLAWQGLLPLLFLFVPMLLNFLHGQDALLLLFFLVSAFAALQDGKDFAAGCFLACGLFKFHLVLVVALLVMSTRSKKVAKGFSSVAFVLLLISVKVSGWGFLVSYPRFLAHFSQLPLAGVNNTQMANLKGLCALAFPNIAPVALGMTVFSSLLVVGLAANSWFASARSAGQAPYLAFGNIIIAGILISYHLSPHDLVLLLLPMALILHHLLRCSDVPSGWCVAFIVTLTLLFLPPLHLLCLKVHVYTYVCFLLLALFAITYAEIRRLSVSLRQ